MREQKSRDPVPRTEQDLLDLALAFKGSRALLTACELDVFSAIGDEAVGAAEVADRVGADPSGTERLLHALCALGVLEKGEAGFSNSPVARRHLVEGGPERVSLVYVAHKWDNWSLLTEAVRRGHPTVAKPFQDPPAVWLRALGARVGRFLDRVWAVLTRSDRWLRAFIDYMRDHARMRAAAVTDLLDLSGVSRVLDVGGGPAVYALAFARAREGLSVTVFDRPEVVPTTRRNVEAAGLSDRIDAVAGDFRADDLGRDYDLVFISEATHAISGSENRDLVRRGAAALRPGGRLVVQDFILEDDRTGPSFAALFSLEMMMTTRSGGTYTRSEVRDWMTAAGLTDVEVMETGMDTTLMIGHRPTG
ncbi:MAG: methyltransferase [Acidobacteriota bacterium]